MCRWTGKAPRLCLGSALTKPVKTKEISQYTEEAEIRATPSLLLCHDPCQR